LRDKAANPKFFPANGRIICSVSALTETLFSVSEAAFITGLTERAVHQEIDQKVIRLGLGKNSRRLKGIDLLYLRAVEPVRTSLGIAFRKRVHQAIVDAAEANDNLAKVEAFSMQLNEIEGKLLDAFGQLERMKRGQIECRADVLAGEPVIKGTRLAVRHIADLIKQGASLAEIVAEFDLSDQQIEAAIVFDRVTPKRGRPVIRKKRIAHVPSAG
jgi:uncharacterized protein (DUF433 family)